MTMHNICKVRGSNTGHRKKKKDKLPTIITVPQNNIMHRNKSKLLVYFHEIHKKMSGIIIFLVLEDGEH
ncbi:hypothetical protein MtrunA17_Chr3g0088061 [Medicago truncatula]|uniref:Uncharacterized protein n=1 Tax=Medicago truncatula TaxID=3880 RepID=A0A396IPB0_MEDTR|nr:hypothetical protein MtrunA17_Chr3g0088061 [Medicago truncatula]